jgi:hypothetical protein
MGISQPPLHSQHQKNISFYIVKNNHAKGTCQGNDHELNPKIQIGNKLQNLKRIKFDLLVWNLVPRFAGSVLGICL